MSGDVAAAEVTPWRPLPPVAIGHLAHDLRGLIHIISGHAELLRAEATDTETRDSAGYIVDASTRLAGLCEDIVDVLRLPALRRGELRALGLAEIGSALTPLARGRGTHARVVAPEISASVLVHSSVHRTVSNVLDHVVRMATSDLTITPTLRPGPESGSSICVITVEPVPHGLDVDADGIVAVAAQLLSARGGHLETDGSRMELVMPVEATLVSLDSVVPGSQY